MRTSTAILPATIRAASSCSTCLTCRSSAGIRRGFSTTNPLPRDIVVRNNRWSGGGTDPQGMLAPMAEALGGTLPAIVSDGATRWPGAESQVVNIVINEAPEVGFVNLGVGAYPINPETLAPSMDRPQGTPVTEPAAVVLPQDAE